MESRAKKAREDAKSRAAKKVAAEEAAAAEQAADEAEEEEAAEEAIQELWTDEVPDVSLGAEEIEQLPTIGRTAKPKAKVNKKTDSASAKMKAALMKQRERLTIAPVRKL